MKDETGTGITFDTFFEEVFSSTATNELLERYASEPPPARLFGEIWREGELAVLFGEAGTGKSILATQIADSIARGSGFGPFETDGGGRKVLYFDLKLSDRQWTERYSEIRDETTKKRRVYGFSKRFERVSVNIFSPTPDDNTNFASVLGQAIGRYAKEKNAGVVVIDNLDMLRRSNDFTRDILPLVRELRRLKRETGLSILVIARSLPRHDARSIELRDLKSARVLYNFADSVFAIGPAAGGTERYLKQIKAGSGELHYDAKHAPILKPARQDGTFLSFEAGHFKSEKATRGGTFDRRDWKTIDRVKELHDKGKSFRAIGRELGISKTAAHQMLQVWEPPPPPPPEPEPDPESDALDEEIDAVFRLGNGYSLKPAELGPINTGPDGTPPGDLPFRGFPPCSDPARYDGLEYRQDRYGKDIWVKTFREWDNKPMEWYYYDPSGRWYQALRVPGGIDLKCLEPSREKYVPDPEPDQEDSS